MAGTLAPFSPALADRYRIERELGRGGMATVYLAEDLKHRRLVAIKVLQPDVAARLGTDRFLREIETVARLNHPRILPLYDSGDANGHLYYVMPYVRGESLRVRLEREGPLPVPAAIEIARQIAGALQFAHDQQLIHRDIKPENILLHEGDAMLADFGIALGPSPARSRLTTPGFSLGTPAYMSPEQAVGDESVDGRSDEYSLACMLFELLAGVPPFTVEGKVVLARRLIEPAPSVRRLRATVPAPVDLAIQRAMALSPGDRFLTVTEFAEALILPAVAPSGRRSVAVLPFLNLSPDPENEYFADGITEDVITQLSRARSLKVISRASVQAFKQRTLGPRAIANQLGVVTVLDGSVRRVGVRVRIVAQLIDGETEEQIWAETYDRHLTDIFAIQTDVALSIARSLQAELSPEERRLIGREPTWNMEAYQSYLLGRHHLITFTTEAMRESLRHFRKAAELDPQFAQAWVGIATAQVELAAVGHGSGDKTYAEAEAAARRAMALNPDLAEAHSILGYILMSAYQWAEAEAAFTRALELNPGNGDTYDLFGRMRAAQCRFDEAIALIRQAQQLDPLVVRVDLATTYLRAGRPAEAEAEIKPKVDADPNFPRGVATLGWARFLQGHHAEGISLLERAAALETEQEGWRAQLGEMYGLAGRTNDARELLRQLSEPNRPEVSPYHLAYVHTGLGEPDLAMDYLERAYRERSGSISTIKGSFLFATLRSHPRFQALLAKMNLADA